MSDHPPIIRAATPNDMGEIYHIHKHYVLNSTATFKRTIVSEESQLSTLQKIQSHSLPFLVANSDATSIVGYCYVSPFRHEGYEHTVELSLFCHPEYLYRGIGTALLSKVLDVLKNPNESAGFVSGVRGDHERVRNVIACMSRDPLGGDDGAALQKWYERSGFVCVGRLEGVGFKFDRWFDAVYLQKRLW